MPCGAPPMAPGGPCPPIPGPPCPPGGPCPPCAGGGAEEPGWGEVGCCWSEDSDGWESPLSEADSWLDWLAKRTVKIVLICI